MANAEHTASTQDEATGPAPAGASRRIAVLLGVAVFAYLLDLLSKLWVVTSLEGHEPISVLGQYLRLEAVRNAGAAFGFGQGMTIVFTLIALTVIGVIARIARKLYSLPWAIALGLLLGAPSATSPTGSSARRASWRGTWWTSSRPSTSRSSTWPTPRSSAAAS